MNLLGKQFNRWLVIEYSHKKHPHHFWKCRCDCGTEKIVNQGSFMSGRTRSCGCLRREINRQIQRTHGKSKTPIYVVWVGMLQRCQNKNKEHYSFYGGRGITVCERWKDFENFHADMGPTYESGLSIDRIDNNGNYEPNNCRWATPKEQGRNRRDNVWLDMHSGVMTLSEAERETGIYRAKLKRIYRHVTAASHFSARSTRRV